jgi:hypothetical protein
LYLAGGSGASVSWMSVGENLLFATIGAYHRRDAGCGHAVLVCVFLGEELRAEGNRLEISNAGGRCR